MIKATRNQIGNCKNAYQTNTKRVLCVCSAGLLRSPTAANILHAAHGYNTRAAGSCEDFALIPVSEVLLHWADEVVFVNRDNLNDMDEEQLKILMGKDVFVLNLPDQFNWNEDGLKQEILSQYAKAKPFTIGC